MCWGYNSDGRLGDGTGVESHIPVAVSGITTAIAIAAGGDHTCALVSGGMAQCWGNNTFGQVGTPSPTMVLSPVMVSTLSSGVDEISVGGSHNCARSGSSMQCWGSNADGQLGSGSGGSNYMPVLAGVGGVSQMAAGGNHTCAIVNSGAVECWGQNTYGQLGDGTNTTHSIASTVNFADPPTTYTITGVGSGAGFNIECFETATIQLSSLCSTYAISDANVYGPISWPSGSGSGNGEQFSPDWVLQNIGVNSFPE